MKALRDFPDRVFTWTQPHALKRSFELRHGNDVCGTLLWEKSSGSLAGAAASDGRWTFKRGGFLRPHVTVREAGSDETIAAFEPNWTGTGTLQFRGGQRFRLLSSGFWRSRWMWVLEDGEEIIAFTSDPRLLRNEGRLEIPATGAGMPELPLLALLGWYLVVLMSDDAAALIVMAS